MSSTIPNTMRAWQYKSAKTGLENSISLQAAAPLPADPAKLPANTTLIKIFAASLNPVDYKLPEVPVVSSVAIKTPAVPAQDFAGIVAATTVPTLKVGQRVFGRANPPVQHGMCAEYTTLTGEANLGALPDSLDYEQGATIGTAGLTAWQSIVPPLDGITGKLHGEGVRGTRIFINGGSGGTGTFGLQIAKALGAEKITASCSSANAELCKGLGADEVIDYRSTDIAHALTEEVSGDLQAKGYDLIVDNVGTPNNLLKASEKFLKPSGRFVQVGASVSLGAAASILDRAVRPSFLGGAKRKWEFVNMKPDRGTNEQLASLVAQGKIKGVVDEKFAFDKVPEAYAKLKTGRVKGKLIVNVTDE